MKSHAVTKLDWDNAALYRKKPARYKAIQYDPDALGILILEATSTEQLDVGDWFVLDIESGKIYVIDESVFGFLFERDDISCHC